MTCITSFHMNMVLLDEMVLSDLIANSRDSEPKWLSDAAWVDVEELQTSAAAINVASSSGWNLWVPQSAGISATPAVLAAALLKAGAQGYVSSTEIADW